MSAPIPEAITDLIWNEEGNIPRIHDADVREAYERGCAAFEAERDALATQCNLNNQGVSALMASIENTHRAQAEITALEAQNRQLRRWVEIYWKRGCKCNEMQGMKLCDVCAEVAPTMFWEDRAALAATEPVRCTCPPGESMHTQGCPMVTEPKP